jgi:hypothetical protein
LLLVWYVVGQRVRIKNPASFATGAPDANTHRGALNFQIVDQPGAPEERGGEDYQAGIVSGREL